MGTQRTLTVSHLREWPRIVSGAVVLAAVLLLVGLLIGASAASSTTTVVRTHTMTTTLTQESPTQAAQIQADTNTIATLHGKLTRTRHRLARADRALRAKRHSPRKRPAAKK
jgi:uncharacterized protein HemX